MNTIPVVLFVYRRPEILKQTLHALRADGVPQLLVFSDGARQGDAAGVDEVSEVRRMIRAIDWCTCSMEESPVNQGLGKSVRHGVKLALETHGAAIFFEDDLVCVPGAYKYLCSALRHYEAEERVMCVTAWTHPAITPDAAKRSGRPYFDGKGECWAWGAWLRSWQGIAGNAVDSMAQCERLGIDIEKYGSDMPKMAAEAEEKNLWAVGWWYHIMSRRGLCLRPPWSMVEQTCWTESMCTTTTHEMLAWRNPPLQAAPQVPSVWPEDPVEDAECQHLWRKAIDGNGLHTP